MAERKEVIVNGMTCANCALTVQKAIEKNGGSSVSIDIASGNTFFEAHESQVSEITKAVQAAGYKVLQTPKTPSKEREIRFLICVFLTIPLLAHMFVPSTHWLHSPIFQFACSSIVILVGGGTFIKGAYQSLKHSVFTMDTLVVIGFVSAYLYSIYGTILFWESHQAHQYLFFETAASVITFVLLGKLIEHRSIQSTTVTLKDLQQLKTEVVKLWSKESLVNKKRSEVEIGEVLQIDEGDSIPLDGEIIDGAIEVDESMINGESTPEYKESKEEVSAGSIVISGNAKLRVTATDGESTIDRIIQLVKEAQASKPEIQRLGDKIAAVFVPIVIALALLTFFGHWWLVDSGITKSISSAIAVLVISCPCAMGLAAPTAIVVAVGKAAKEGILVKKAQAFEILAKANTIVFDKTGTLTDGNFVIEDIQVQGESQGVALQIIKTLCLHSSHPISKSLAKEITDPQHEKLTQIQEIKGSGLRGMLQEDTYALLSRKATSLLVNPKDHSKTDNFNLFLMKNDEIVARLKIADKEKKSAVSAIKQLQSQGIKCVLLSGDQEEKCKSFVEKIGIKEWYSEQSPQEKLAVIKRLKKQGQCIMVGDGINDAPALSAAHLGISFSNATDLAGNSADLLLMQEDLHQLLLAKNIGKACFSTIKQNFFWAFFYNTLAIPVAAIGQLKPMFAALAMAFSDVIVVGNSLLLRLKKIKTKNL